MYTYKIADSYSTIYEFKTEENIKFNANEINVIPSSHDEFFYINDVSFFVKYKEVENGNNYSFNLKNQKEMFSLPNVKDLKIEINQPTSKSIPNLTIESESLSFYWDIMQINYITFKSSFTQEDKQSFNVLKNKDEAYFLFSDGQKLFIKNIEYIEVFSGAKPSSDSVVFYIKTHNNKIYFIKNISLGILIDSEKRNGKNDLIIHQNGGKLKVPNVKRTDIAFNIADGNINIESRNENNIYMVFLENINSAYLEPQKFINIIESDNKNVTGVVSV